MLQAFWDLMLCHCVNRACRCWTLPLTQHHVQEDLYVVLTYCIELLHIVYSWHGIQVTLKCDTWALVQSINKQACME